MNGGQKKRDVVVAVVYDVLRDGMFGSIADLSEAVKCRCARLRVPYDATRIADAIEHVRKVKGEVIATPKARTLVERAPDADVRPLSREEAADLARRLKAAVEREAKRSEGEVMEPQTANRPAPEDVLTALKAVIIAWDAGRPIEFNAAIRSARRLLGLKKHGGDGE